MNKKFDPYEVLGVDRNATEAEIKKAAKQSVAVIDAKIAEVEIMIESTKLALELLASYHYDFDKPQSTVMNYYFTTT